MFRCIAILFANLALCPITLLAHAPYEKVAGTFLRSDKAHVTAIEYYTDGILGADPVSVKFRLSDGTPIGETKHSVGDVVVLTDNNGFSIYRFPDNWLPAASIVQRFDGFNLSDETPGAWVFSGFVHTRVHLREYLVILVLITILTAFWRLTHAIPKTGALTLLKVVLCIVAAFGSLFVLLLVLVAPISPFVLCIFVVPLGLAYWLVGRALTGRKDSSPRLLQ